MSFFQNFPLQRYKFGSETEDTLIQNLSAYVDIVDNIKNNISFYNKIVLRDGTRPDQLSQQLYGTPNYYWTFYLMNDHVRKFGWPLSMRALETFAKKKYPNTTLVIREYFYDKFSVGQTIRGQTSNVSGVILNMNSDLGQITVKKTGSSNFQASETIELVSDTTKTVVLNSFSAEYNAARFYRSGTEQVDIDPTAAIGATLTKVTHINYYTERNTNSLLLRVLKPSSVTSVVSQYSSSLRSNA